MTGQYAASINLYQFGNVRPLPFFWITFGATGIIGGGIVYLCMPSKEAELAALATANGLDDGVQMLDTAMRQNEGSQIDSASNIKSLPEDGESVQAVQMSEFTGSPTTATAATAATTTPTDITSVIKLLTTKNIVIYNIFMFIVSFAYQSTICWAVRYYFDELLDQENQIAMSTGVFSFWYLYGAGAVISDIIRPFRSDISQFIGFGVVLVCGMPLILGASADGTVTYSSVLYSRAVLIGKEGGLIWTDMD